MAEMAHHLALIGKFGLQVIQSIRLREEEMRFHIAAMQAENALQKGVGYDGPCEQLTSEAQAKALYLALGERI